MSLPRQVLPGQFYLITRRCTQRQFLLRPDRDTNNAFTYCLIEAAQRCGAIQTGVVGRGRDGIAALGRGKGPIHLERRLCVRVVMRWRMLEGTLQVVSVGADICPDAPG